MRQILRTTFGIASLALVAVVTSACSLAGPAVGAIQPTFTPSSLEISEDGTASAVSVSFTVRAGTTGGYLQGYTIEYLDASGNALLDGGSRIDVDGVGLRLPRGSSCEGFGCGSTPADQVSGTLSLATVPTDVALAFSANGNTSGRAEVTWRAINDHGNNYEWTSVLAIVSVP